MEVSTQSAFGLHVFAQEPQLVEDQRLASQPLAALPSQLAQSVVQAPGMQAKAAFPVVCGSQETAWFGFAEQAFPQAPQFERLLISQPRSTVKVKGAVVK